MGELHSMYGLALFAAAIAGLAVAHRAVLRLPTGLPRLVFILPLLPIFFMLPWTISIYHLRAILSFIFLWTVPSKLLLLCWDAGIDYPSSGFLYFATIVMLPIRVKGKKVHKHVPNSTHKRQFWWQFIAVIAILNVYSYRNGLPLAAIYVLYACHMYLGLELMLGGLAKLATACFGVESDPQFNNPFMSASLSEFWGRRWNLVVTTILRSTVYNPALLFLMKAEKQKANQLGVERKPASFSACKGEWTRNVNANAVIGTPQYNGLITANRDNTHAEWLVNPVLGFEIQGSSELSHHLKEINDSVSSGNLSNTKPQHAMQASNLSDRNPNSAYASDCMSSGPSISVVEPVLYNTYPHANPNDSEMCPDIHHIKPDERFTRGSAENPMLNGRPAGRSKVSPEHDSSSDWKPGGAGNGRKIADSEQKSCDEKPSLRARAVAMLATFVVSGLVHELIFYYINKSRATGEVTAFFIVHGCATAMETLLRKTLFAQVRLPRPLSIAMTLAFLYVTSAWLFMPPLTRNGADINTIAEYQRLQSALLSLFINK